MDFITGTPAAIDHVVNQAVVDWLNAEAALSTRKPGDLGLFTTNPRHFPAASDRIACQAKA
jgi:hypothetical protein